MLILQVLIEISQIFVIAPGINVYMTLQLLLEISQIFVAATYINYVSCLYICC